MSAELELELDPEANAPRRLVLLASTLRVRRSAGHELCYELERDAAILGGGELVRGALVRLLYTGDDAAAGVRVTAVRVMDGRTR